MPVSAMGTAAGMATLVGGYVLLGPRTRTMPATTAADRLTATQVAGLTKAQAEDLLDSLEAQGLTGCTVTCDETGRFTVHLPQANEPAAS